MGQNLWVRVQATEVSGSWSRNWPLHTHNLKAKVDRITCSWFLKGCSVKRVWGIEPARICFTWSPRQSKKGITGSCPSFTFQEVEVKVCLYNFRVSLKLPPQHQGENMGVANVSWYKDTLLIVVLLYQHLQGLRPLGLWRKLPWLSPTTQTFTLQELLLGFSFLKLFWH